MIQLNRLEEVLQILKSVVEFDDPNNVKHTISEDVLANILECAEKVSNPTIKEDFHRIGKILVKEGLVTDYVSVIYR